MTLVNYISVLFRSYVKKVNLLRACFIIQKTTSTESKLFFYYFLIIALLLINNNYICKGFDN